MPGLLELNTDISWTFLLSGALVAFLCAVSVGSLAVFRAHNAEREHLAKSSMLPAIDELRAAEASLNERRSEIQGVEGRLSELRREQAEAERHQIDATHWQNLAEEAERAYRSKDEIINSVEELRNKYEEAAKDLASRTEEIAGLVRERDGVDADIKEMRNQLDELEEKQQEIEDIERRIEEKSEELAAVRSEIGELRDEREELLQARFDVDQLNRRKAELEAALEQLPEEVQKLNEEKDELEKFVAELEQMRNEVRESKDEVDRLVERKLGLNTDIEALQREKVRLENEVGGVRRRRDEMPEDEKDELLQDLFARPACLFHKDTVLLPDSIDDDDESNMLQKVRDHLEAQNLTFSDRVLKRFHTCLKTSRISPLTVLAGISGTGKSQLPQRYAEGMGMHFLKVAVQPRWDSPQDVLGFYNYLEQSFKATELSRALLCMDKHSSLEQGGKMQDRILLVLLDEMNLARVEYYFSEFLSRLEGRPESNVDSLELLRPGQIEIDIPAENRDPVTIYPGHNVLFSGTMNEDESTQALSDKVLDRANTIRFPRPEVLEKETQEDSAGLSEEHLPFDTWLGWQKTINSLGERESLITDFIDGLNKDLDSFGRPFGHRVNQAIFSYVANHPDSSTEEGVRLAIADMLEMRILPKLRGIELEGAAREGLDSIRGKIDNDLQEHDLAAAIDKAMDGSDLFTWSGM